MKKSKKDPMPTLSPYDPRSKTGNERYGDWGSDKDLYIQDLLSWIKRNIKK